ncbi:MAG: ABC transporter permease subunit [Clostridia bacterium]|nr:ABC transporter permease subunit [Clostridia bacterium]
MKAIYKRELASYFTSPLGYVFMAIFLCLSGILFSSATLQKGADSDVNMYFVYLLISFIIILPLLTMKLFSEERKTKTEQLLLTSPITITGMVMGKFFAAYTVFAMTYAASCIPFLSLYAYGTPNTAQLIGHSVGILLLGAACIAVGVFVSSLTENQLIAAIGSMALLFAFVMVGFLSSYINSAFIRSVLGWISILERYNAFGNGVFDFSCILYYVSMAAVFLFATVRVFEKRRWS